MNHNTGGEDTSLEHGRRSAVSRQDDGAHQNKRTRLLAGRDNNTQCRDTARSNDDQSAGQSSNIKNTHHAFPSRRQFTSAFPTTSPVIRSSPLQQQPQQAQANQAFLFGLPRQAPIVPVQYDSRMTRPKPNHSLGTKHEIWNPTAHQRGMSTELPTDSHCASPREDKLTATLDFKASPNVHGKISLPVFPTKVDFSHVPYRTDAETWSENEALIPAYWPVEPDSFVYSPLDGSSSDIRLLRMDRSDRASGLHCTLVSVQPWKEDTPYECLSYCWGRTDSRRRICLKKQLDDKYENFSITANLYNALQELENSHSERYLWVDAICIDQSNIEERNSQVNMMKDIYDRASGIVIWLGQNTTSLSASVMTMNVIATRFQEDTGRSSHSIVGSDGLDISSEELDRLKTYTSTTPEYAYKLVAHFFSLPYFRRIWVLQEVVSRGTVAVHLGQHVLHWGSVILAALWQSCFTRTITASTASDFRGLDTQAYLPELWLSLLHRRSLRGMPMLELVSHARDFGASDARDKVFALLGLANDIPELSVRPAGLRPNYTKSKIDVYSMFAKDLILTTHKLDVLSLVDTFSTSQTDVSAPSWMPNLDIPIATIRHLGLPMKYEASSSSEVDVGLLKASSKNFSELQVSGFEIDQIAYITPDMLSFTRDLRLYLGRKDAVMALWEWILPSIVSSADSSEDVMLRRYVELLTAAGFAMPTEFPANPIGEVVPSRRVQSIMADFAAYWARLDPTFSHFDIPQRDFLLPKIATGDADQFAVLAGKGCHERKFFITQRGRMGLCPRNSIDGDIVVILHGGSVPYVLRTIGPGIWRFIGECYLDGVMFGEMMSTRYFERVFALV